MYGMHLPFRAKNFHEILIGLTQSVWPMMARWGFHSVVVYLEDFLVIDQTIEEYQLLFDTLLQLI